jgi:hypothetical protein
VGRLAQAAESVASAVLPKSTAPRCPEASEFRQRSIVEQALSEDEVLDRCGH